MYVHPARPFDPVMQRTHTFTQKKTRKFIAGLLGENVPRQVDA